MENINQNILKGGAFLIQNQNLDTVFTKEALQEDALQFSEMVRDFVEMKVAPNFAKLDKGAFDLMVELLKEAGALGILSTSLPEEYGGMNVDFNTETAISEEIGKSHSFSVACAAHTGIGTLPILYFGNTDQKNKYLSDLGSGVKFASYCLTEPGSGSDALGAKTKAMLSEDGKHYILNGQKMWITNAGFADIFIVFAQIDGNKFTGFIVEKGTEGLTLGAEEDKMGIKGSSTRQVFLENVKVPVENVLGEIGKGHKIAFNVLNIGRYKLCVMALGGARRMLDLGINYANERQQFGTSISNFGAIKEKIANMAISIFATESSSYRVSGLINDLSEKLIQEGATKSEAKLAAAEEYSIECAALKVLGSETLDLVTDEVVQIYGGMGYSEEAPAARAYRDSRINRIFEGTNEINRLLAVGTLAKKAMKGQLDLMKPAMEAQKDLMSISFDESNDALFDREYKTIEKAKKAILLVAGGAMQKYMLEFEKQQELIMSIADMLFDVLQAESTLLRVHKLVEQNGIENEALKVDILNIFMSESMERVYINGKKAISNFAEGDMLTMMHMGLKRFTKYPILDTISAKRRIADHCIKENVFKL